MTKAELINRVAEKLGLSKPATKNVIETVLGSIKEGIIESGDMKISDFGSFKLRTTAERKGRNVRTGEEKIIPPKKTIKFKLSKSVKEILNAAEKAEGETETETV